MIAAAALLCATCSSAPPSSLGQADIDSVEAADRIIATRVSPAENALLINAHGAVVEACMQALGWDFEVPTATPEMAAGGPSFLSQLQQWTFADVATARVEGYGLEAYLAEQAEFLADLGAMEHESRVPDVAAMSPDDATRYQVDYFGTDDERVEIIERDGSPASVAGGGCIGEASRAVWGDIEQEMRLRDARGSAQSEIWIRTLDDDAVRSSVDGWRRCTDRRGFDFEDPTQAFAAALTAAQAGNFKDEFQVATIDATCKVEAGLDSAVQGAFLAATNELLPDLEEDLLGLQELEAGALERAKHILKFGD